MIQDLRYAFRGIRRKPSVAAAAILTLALGIGGATTVFSVVETVVLRPLPYGEPDRLVRIWELTRDGARFSASEPTFLDLQAASRTLAHVAAYRDGAPATLDAGGEPHRVRVVPIAASFDEVLGVTPRLGHAFSADDDRPDLRQPPVLISDALWRNRFGASRDVPGRLIALDGETHRVAGVMPAGFAFPAGADIWVPLGADPAADRGNKDLAVIARMAPGVTADQVNGELRGFARRLSDAHPESNGGWGFEAVTFDRWIVGPRVREAVWVLFGAVGLLLLLACANVSNLLVAQAVSRRGEMRLRAALGAGRGRLVRQLLTEAGLLAAAGTALGLLIAFWSVDLVQAIGLGRVPRLDELQVNGVVLLFASMAGIASVLLFGLAPALYATAGPGAASDPGARVTPRGRGLRQGLVVVEVALALLLLVGTGLLANSFVRLMRVDPGFETGSTLALSVDLPVSRYSGERAVAFYRELEDRVRALPGVTAAGATTTNPFRQGGFSNNVTPEERAADAPPSGLVQAGWRSVTPGFFEAMGIPLLSGRTFGDADREGAERVVVVSAGLARRLWPGESAVGKRLFWGGTTGRTRTVVGIVGDIRDVQLDADPTPMLFLPHAQVPVPSLTLVVLAPAGSAVAGALRETVRSLDPALLPPAIEPIDASRSASAAQPRFNLLLLGAFTAIALVLAVTGVYAMLAFSVSERRRELAVRLALGADGPGIVRLVLRTGLGLAALGVAAGIVLALAATRLLSGLLYGVEPTDPVTFGAAAAALTAAAALACWLPARQAARLDAATVLRE